MTARIWQGLSVAAIIATLVACTEDPVEAPQAYLVPVTVGEVQRQDIVIASEVVGTLAPWREVTIAPETTGIVSQLAVELGDRVSQGSLLFRIDATDAQLAVDEAMAALESAEATLLEAEASHARVARIAESGVATEGDLDSAVRTLAVARAAERRASVNLNQAREALGDCTVTAPISGEITRRMIEIGENVAFGTPSIEIADRDRVKFIAEITEHERVPLHVGQPVQIAVDALRGETFEGTIHALGASADPGTLTFPIEVAIDNPGHRLLGGMIARARLVLEERPQMLVIPIQARVARLESAGVFTIVTGETGSPEALFRGVEFGDRHGDTIEITEGLGEGDEIVVRGAEGLRDGVPVRVTRGG
ncbi:efflux RND transporter periplasmic adaptor subunit [Candidatus Sumerlaeota bacterium]|nr:efflux RND transporter periplasmic adaptor subunit [Candidatus Sumerlaeota bacterium]